MAEKISSKKYIFRNICNELVNLQLEYRCMSFVLDLLLCWTFVCDQMHSDVHFV